AMLAQSAAMVTRYFNSNREGAAAIDRIRAMSCFACSNEQKDLPRIEGELDGHLTLVCQDLWVRYPGSDEAALRGFSYRFAKGRIYAVAGPSGSGKSTLFNVILGLQRAERGRVAFHPDIVG